MVNLSSSTSVPVAPWGSRSERSTGFSVSLPSEIRGNGEGEENNGYKDLGVTL